MRRINLPLVLGGAVLLVAGVISVVVLHRYQVRRNAASMLLQVDQRLEEGAEDEAIALLAKYLILRPGDAGTQRRYAELLLSRCESGNFTRQSLATTVAAMERAMRSCPDDDALRDRFATFLIAINQPGMARDHLAILAERVRPAPDGATAPTPPAATGEPAADEPLDPAAITVRLALSSAAVGRFDEAETMLATLVGYDPVTRDFADARAPAPPAAYVALSDIVEQQRGDPAAARRIVERLATDRPDDPDTLKYLARWYVAHRDADEAEATQTLLRTLLPDDFDTHFLEYELAMMRGDIPRAEAILTGPLADAPALLPIVLARADLLRRKGDIDGSFAVLREAMESEPRQLLFRAALISALADFRRIDDLRPLVEESRSMFPKNHAILSYADATIAMAERRWLPALHLLETLRPLVRADRHLSRQVDSSLALCHAALGQHDQAAEARSRVVGSGVGIRQSALLDIDELELAGRADEALAAAEAAVAKVPAEELGSMPQLWERCFRLAVAAQVRLPEAQRDWSNVEGLLATIALSPDVDAAILERRRIDLVSARDGLAAALEASDAALAARPGSAPLLGQHVMLLTQSKRVDEARRLIEGMPEEIRDSYDVIDAELRLGAFLPPRDAAVWLAEVEGRLARLEDIDADRAARSLVAIHFGRGSIADAERIARAAVERNRENLPLQQVLLDLVVDRGDADAAEAQAATLVDLAGRDTATGRAAEAAAIITRVAADRASRLERSPEDAPLTDEERATLDRARALLVQAGQDRPRWSDVPRRLAAIAELQGDSSAAIGLLRQASELRENLPLARRRLALLLVLAGRSDEARAVVESLGQAGGMALERLKVEAVLGMGRKQDALALAARLIPDDCRDAELLLWYASLLSRAGRSDEALAACRRTIDADRSDPRAWAALVGALAASGSRQEALAAAAEARQALDEAKRDRFETMIADRLGDPREIEAERRAAVAAAPSDLEAARSLVETLLRENKPNQAREELRRLVSLDVAGSPSTMLWARRLLARQIAPESHRDLLEALALLRRNVDGDGRQLPEDVALSISLLLSRPEPARWRQAAALFEELAKRRALSVDERVEQAAIQARLGQRGRARDELVVIAASPSSSPRVLVLLAEIALEEGDLNAAGKWIEMLRTSLPNSVATLRLDARLALARGDRAKAGEIVRRMLPQEAVTPATALQFRDRAEIAVQLGFPEAADQVLAACAANSPRDTLARAPTLARMRRLDEALDLAESVQGQVPPVILLAALNDVVRSTVDDIGGAELATIDSLLDRVRRENPGAADVAIQCATLDEALGRSADAERAYRELLAAGTLTPVQTAIVSANLAWILVRPDSVDEAADLVERAITILGPVSELVDTRALIRLAKDQKVLALEDIREAVLVPSAQKYLHLAFIAAEVDDVADAEKALKKARALGLDNERLSGDDRLRLERLEARLARPTGET